MSKFVKIIVDIYRTFDKMDITKHGKHNITKGVFDMKKTEMKNIIKTIAAKHNITIINKSFFIDGQNAFVHGYKFNDGLVTCVEMYFNFGMGEYSIQWLSSVCVHDATWYDI